ncbi:Zinc finger, CCHC-type [Sesbania bispinosa]|nr:Zinc finger, CCHC-type [Sesbania bispinosa]
MGNQDQEKDRNEGLYPICFNCGNYGHKSDGCPDNDSMHEDGTTMEIHQQNVDPDQDANIDSPKGDAQQQAQAENSSKAENANQEEKSPLWPLDVS